MTTTQAPTQLLTVAPISAAEHLQFVERHSGSFLQTPAWGQVKAEWTHESLGWFDGDELVGVALVLYRRTPRIERYLAYVPEGPVVNWQAFSPRAVTTPLVAYLARRKVFTVKIGPQVVTRRWSDDTVKRAIKEGARRLSDVAPDTIHHDAIRLADRLRALGWTRDEPSAAGFGDLQPRYVFQVPIANRTDDDAFGGFNQLWRRNVRKAERAGVIVEQGRFDDLARFHEVYVETAQRDGFTPRPLEYFQGMWTAMRAENDDRIRLYLATFDDAVVAATTWVKVGSHVWYSYGASSTAHRDVRASNAIQWRMLTDAIASGADVYDLRGISDTLDEADPLFGLIRFKLGTGGEAIEYLGEWDYAISPLLHKAFRLYLARR